MATSAPRMALGLEILNTSFSIPSDTANTPAGWTVTTGSLTATGMYSGGPSPGHVRYQRYVLSAIGSASIQSTPSPPYKLCGNSSTNLSAWVHVNMSGLSTVAGALIKFGIEWFNSAGASLGSTYILTFGGLDYIGWNIFTATSVYTVPATAYTARLRIWMEKTGAGDLTLDVAFFDVGTWPLAGGYYALPMPSHPDTQGKQSYSSNDVRDTYNHRVRIDSDRYVDPHRVALGFSHLTNAHKLALEYAHAVNHGRSWEGITGNPGGGSWPIILAPGQPSCIGIGLFDIDSDDFPLSLFSGYYTDPPYWNGVVPFLEVV